MRCQVLDLRISTECSFRERGHLQQALYCYKKATQLDPNNVDALWDRALLAKDINDVKGVRSMRHM